MSLNQIDKPSPEIGKIISALKEFRKNGKVQEALVRGFTQHGNWIGIQGLEKYNSQLSFVLQGHILDKSQRTKIDKNNNLHLLTSYRNIDKGPKTELPYATIAGSLCCPLCKHIVAPNLRSIGGKAEMPNATKVELPKLKIINGFLDLGRANEVKLPMLKEVTGSVNIYRAKLFDAPKLKIVDYIKFPSISIKNKIKILKNLSTKSLKTFKKIAYEVTELSLINKELSKRKIMDNIQTSSSQREISLL